MKKQIKAWAVIDGVIDKYWGTLSGSGRADISFYAIFPTKTMAEKYDQEISLGTQKVQAVLLTLLPQKPKSKKTKKK